MEAGADRVAEGIATVGENVVEGVVKDEVHLGAQTDVLAEREVSTTTDAVEASPIVFEGGECEPGDDDFLEGGGGMGDGALAEGTERRTYKQRRFGEVPVSELRAEGEGLGSCVGGNGEVVVGGQKTESNVLGLSGVDLGLGGGGHRSVVSISEPLASL